MRTLLLDADSLVYQACRAHEYETCWGDDLWTVHGHLQPAIEHLTESVEELRERLEATDVVMALSDYVKPWRKEIMPSYKANRKDVRKPVTYRPLRDYIHESFTTFQRQGLEGDDVLSILATNPEVIKGEKIIVSLDKDLKGVPGSHHNMEKNVSFERSLADADYFFFTQILTGDTTDGYKGCPGVGPVGAQKVLAPFYDGESFDNAGAWQAIVKAYEKAKLNEEEALRTARVARLLRHGEYNYTTKEVILWTPPKQ